jgi:hypothetical protein
MERTYATSMVLLSSIFMASMLAAGAPALARDDLPESLRIEQQAEKDYAKKPVVPIDRGNAHHRNLGGSGNDELPPADIPDAATPDDSVPPVPTLPSDNGSTK